MMRVAIAGLLALGLAQPDGVAPHTLRQVPVPVVVHDSRERAVPALTAADFQVHDRGETLPVLAVDYVPPPPGDGAGDPAPGASVAVDDAAATEPGTRVFAFYLDEFHVAPSATALVRELVGGFIRSHTSDRDVFVVVKPLDPLLSLPLYRGRRAALDAVASFEGRAGVYEPRTSLERDLMASDPARLDRSRARVATSAIQAVATRLGRLGPARKAFVLVSDGVAPVTGIGGRTGGSGATVDSIVRAANRGNVSVSTLVPRLLSDAAAPSSDEIAAGLTFLSELVRLTDGRRVGATPADGWPAIAADLGGYYVVTVNGADDGEFHALAVSVARPGVRVRTRPGYWAVAGAEIARAVKAMAPRPARPVLPPLRTSRMIRPWIGQERGESGQTRLTFVWEPLPSRAGDRARVLPPSRLVLTARTTDGAAVYEGVVHGGAGGVGSSVAHFEAPAGRVRLEMSIEDASARVIDTDVRDVVVGALGGKIAFGTPRVYRARTAREFKELAGDPDAVPTAARSFARVEHLLIRAPFYQEPGGGAADIDAFLMNRLAQVMRPLPVSRDSESAMAVTDLSLAGLAAGEYSVRWRARQGGEEVLETVAFRIVP